MSQSKLTYELRDGLAITYDPERHLPPDIASEALGWEAAAAVDRLRANTQQSDKEVRVFEFGVGTGVVLASLLARVTNPDDILIDGIDIDPNAVRQTRANLAANFAIKQWGDSGIIEGDWNDPQLRHELANRNGYHVVIANPPFYPKTEVFSASGYDKAPDHTLFTSDDDGTEHYHSLSPLLNSMLGREIGSMALVRVPFFRNNPGKALLFDNLVADAFIDQKEQISIVSHRAVPLSEQRTGAWITITRTGDVNNESA